MARLGDDVIEWQTEQLVEWLQQEGLYDCVGPFTTKKLNGRSLVNLSELDIKSLNHVSHESKKKLIRAVEKYKHKKKEKMERMFGGGRQVQTVNTRKPPSFCQEDDAGSDDDGWGSEEWDSDGSQEDASSGSDGDYLEPEEDLSKKGSLGKETVSVPTGLVAQLRAGIANSLRRPNQPAAPEPSYEEDDIYDEPPVEEELYEEPSDSSGGAVVVRPSPKKLKPPKAEDRADYLQPREMEEDQDMYETPLQEEDMSPQLPARPKKTNRFIPTKVANGNKFVPVVNNNNDETYDAPDLEEEEEESYEIPGEPAAPPPRPPKGGALGNQHKPSPFQKPSVSGKPPPRVPVPQPIGQPQRGPARLPGSNPPRPTSSNLTRPGIPFRSQPPTPAKTKVFPSQLAGRPAPEQKKPVFSGGQGPSFNKSPPESPVKGAGEKVAPRPLGPSPRPVPRAGILNRMEPGRAEKPSWEAEAPSPSPSPRHSSHVPSPFNRKPASLPTGRPPPPEPIATPTVDSVSPEPVPPRPPKKAQPVGNQQPSIPPRNSGERQGVPLPPRPPVNSPDRSSLKDQSSGSSIESGSADDPIFPLPNRVKQGKRNLPAPPPTETKSPMELMKDAPWFQGPVDRRSVEASLKQLNADGSFLVRNSTKNLNEYSMSLIYKGSVRHLRIPHKNNKYVLGDSGTQKFDSIIDLVNHYRQHEVDLKTGGKTKLTIACQVYKS